MRLTPAGPGAIAVVRISGERVETFLKEHFSKPARTGRCVHGELRDGDRVIDDPVVVRGPNFADLNLHGGELIVRDVLKLAQSSGFEIADPSSSPIDADNILEQEMLAALPAARTERAIRQLLAQPGRWVDWIASNDQLLSHSWRNLVAEILDDRALWRLLNPPRVAIVGPANAGKSTLANQLFGHQRSITADVPGTTRDWVGDWANLDGLAIHLLDTPGQRQSTDAIEQAAIANSLPQIAAADLVVLLLDASRPLAGEQAHLREHYPNALVVQNKSDLPALWRADSLGALHTVASAGTGVDALRETILKHFGITRSDSSRPQWWTERQREILVRSLTERSEISNFKSGI